MNVVSDVINRGEKIKQGHANYDINHTVEQYCTVSGKCLSDVYGEIDANEIVYFKDNNLRIQIPSWQFEKSGKKIEGLEKALDILDDGGLCGDWKGMVFFLQRRFSSNGERIIDILRDGNINYAVSLARDYVN